MSDRLTDDFDMAQCPACGASNPSDSRFCGACGKPLVDDASPSRLVGRIIADRYRVKRVVAEGGMGVVYEAEQTLGEGVRSVAIKTLLPELSRDHLVVSRFSRECAVVASLEHPNIVRVYDFGKTDDGILYIAMEFVRGRPLGDVMAEGALPIARSLAILEQMCSALAEAHDLGIVHRDLKPDNVVLSERAGIHDFVKLLDFGIAKRSSTGGKLDTKLTQQGMVLGTPPYMSPEQFTAEVPDRTSDIYALAVILYEMLNGRLPFDADTPWQWAHHHMSSEPLPFEPSVPLALQRVILRAMSKQRQMRPATTLEFYRELVSASGTISERPGSVRPSAAPSVAPRSDVARDVPRTEPSMIIGDPNSSYPPVPRPYATSPHTLSDAPKGGVTEPGNDAGQGRSRTGTAVDVAPLAYRTGLHNGTATSSSNVPRVTAAGSAATSGGATEPSAFGLGPRATTNPLVTPPVIASPRGRRSSGRSWGRGLAWAVPILVLTCAAVAGTVYWYDRDDGTPPLPSAIPLETEQPPVEITGERRTTEPAWPQLAEVSRSSERATPSRSNPAGVPSRREEPTGQGGSGATPSTGAPSTSPNGPGSGGAPSVATLPFPFPIPIPTGIIPFPPQNPSTPSTTPTTPQVPPANPASCSQAMATAGSNLDAAVDYYQTCNSSVGGATAAAARLTIINTGRAKIRSLARQGRCQEASAVVTTLSRVNAQSIAQRDLQQSGCAG
ncbi:MAG: protein kinase [Polyangiaceae bacterium]